MSEFDFSVLYNKFPAIIELMPEIFTSHQFILRLAEENQVEYIEALYSYRHNFHRGHPAPFLMVHATLANHLNSYPGLITQVQSSIASHDIFGNQNNCSEWRKNN